MSRPGHLQHCILGLGIPTSQEAFQADRSRKDKDYAKSYRYWNKYKYHVMRAVQRVEPYLIRWGVQVVYDLTLADFGRLLRQPDLSVFILVAHWLEYTGNKESQVEFSDGLTSVSKVVEKVPEDYHGILDLCVCHPMSLVDELDRNRSNTVKKFIPKKATAYFWLYFYVALFKQMHDKNVSYLRAFEDTVREFFKLGENQRRKK
ncbi:MAG: hypothetical protein ACRERU_09545 [Methylococcales bacterium]